MTIKIQDVIKVNVVFVGIELLDTPKGSESFKDSVNSEVIVQEGTTFTAGSGGNPTSARSRTFMVQKDRILLECSQINSIAQRDYPSREDLNQLAKITNRAIVYTAPTKKPKSFGFNIDLVYETDSQQPASEYIAEKVFSPVLFETEEKIVGSSGGFTIDEGRKLWGVKIEPRFNAPTTQNIFLSVNHHFNEGRFPEEEELLQFLEETWEKAITFAKRIHGNA